MACFTVSRESWEPSVGIRICLNMARSASGFRANYRPGAASAVDSRQKLRAATADHNSYAYPLSRRRGCATMALRACVALRPDHEKDCLVAPVDLGGRSPGGGGQHRPDWHGHAVGPRPTGLAEPSAGVGRSPLRLLHQADGVAMALLAASPRTAVDGCRKAQS